MISDCDNNSSWSELGGSGSWTMNQNINARVVCAKDDSRSSMMLNYRCRRILKLNTNFELYIGVLIRRGDIYAAAPATTNGKAAVFSLCRCRSRRDFCGALVLERPCFTECDKMWQMDQPSRSASPNALQLAHHFTWYTMTLRIFDSTTNHYAGAPSLVFMQSPNL